jgi:multiple sugar transport system substrate-binding protein
MARLSGKRPPEVVTGGASWRGILAKETRLETGIAAPVSSPDSSMRTSRRSYLRWGSLSLAGVLGIACRRSGQEATQAGETASGATRPPVTVRVHARAGSEDEAYQKRTAEFTQQNDKNITAVYEPLGDYYNSLVTQIVAGTAGDITYMHHTNLAYQQYAHAGVLRAIDDLIARDRFDFSPWYPPVRPAMVFEGKIWGLPIRGQTVWNMLFFNPHLVSGAGLPDPETWTHDDLTTNMHRLTTRGAAGAVTTYGAMHHGWGDFSYTVSLMRRFGGEVMSQDGKQVTINSPECQAALQWYYDGWHRHRVLRNPRLPQGEAIYDALGNGGVAMVISAQGGARANMHQAIKDAYQLEFRVMPNGPGKRVGGFLAINSSSILQASPHPNESWEVLKWLANKDSSYALATQQTGSNTPNLRRDSYCDERLLNDPRFSRKSMEAICKGAELREPDALIWNLRYADFNSLLQRRMNEVRDNQAEPTVGWLNTVRAELQAIAEQPRETGIGGR